MKKLVYNTWNTFYFGSFRRFGWELDDLIQTSLETLICIYKCIYSFYILNKYKFHVTWGPEGVGGLDLPLELLYTIWTSLVFGLDSKRISNLSSI